jgi:parvulin-like peptidyl-prolyl isomerase
MWRSVLLIAALLASFTSIAGDDRPLARYYGKTLPRGDYDAEMNSIRAQFRANPKKQLTPEKEALYKRRFLQSRLEVALVNEALARHKISVTDAELNEAVKEQRTSFKDEKGFQSWLSANGMSVSDYKGTIRHGLAVDKLATTLVGAKKPTKADVERELTQNPDKWGTPEQVRARQIFLKFKPNPSEADKNEVRRRIMGIYSQVQDANSKKFAAVAARYDEGPSSDGKGFLGDVRKGRMTRTWDEQVFAAHPNEIVGPFQTPFGFHIVLVEAKSEPQAAKLGDVTPLVMEQLVARFRKDSYRELLKKLYVEASVEILEPDLQFDAETLANPDKACATCK